jgi:hypothetical protein
MRTANVKAVLRLGQQIQTHLVLALLVASCGARGTSAPSISPSDQISCEVSQ